MCAAGWRSATGLERCVLAAAAVLPVALGAWGLWRSEGTAVAVDLDADEGVVWITPPEAVDAKVRRAGPGHARAAVFERGFETHAGGADAGTAAGSAGAAARESALRVRAFDSVRVHLDGRVVFEAESGCRKHVCEARFVLPAGRHRLRARVRNADGPPLLWLDLRSAATRVSSAAGWVVAPDRPHAQHTAAVRADDRRPFAPAQRTPSAWQGLRADSPALALWFAVGAAAFLAAQRHPALLRAAPHATLALGLSWWAWFFSTRLLEVGLRSGFDVAGHLEYVRLLLERGALPVASDGWATFHPPLPYALSALLVGACDPAPGSALERACYRALPALFAAANVAVAYALARTWLAGRPLAQTFAVAMAALTPVAIYDAAYFSNEPAHAFFATLAVAGSFRILEGRAATVPRLLAIGALLGAAMLSKYTGWGVAAVCALALALGAHARGRGLPGALAPAAVIGAVSLAVSGWFYVRHWWLFGDPFVWNFDVGGSRVYWTQPGFHTPAWFVGFGASLVHPYFSSFHSLLDGLYSTWWGDGLVAGFVAMKSAVPQWDATRMTATYLLALPATAAALAGFVASARDAICATDPGRRLPAMLLVLLVWLLLFAAFWKNLTVPFYGAARSSYLLCLVVPVSLLAGRGLSEAANAVRRSGLPRRWALMLQSATAGWAMALCVTIARTYAG